MGLSVTCACGKKMVAAEKFAGRKAKCPVCGAILEIPALAPERGLHSPTNPAVPSAAGMTPASALSAQAWQDGLMTQHSTPWLAGDEERFQRGVKAPFEGLRRWQKVLLSFVLVVLVAGAGWVLWDRGRDLDLVPGDAVGFVSLRMADVWTSKSFEKLRDMVSPQEQEEIRQTWGFYFDDIERITLVFFKHEYEDDPPPFFFLVQANRRLDRRRILMSFWQQVGPRSKVREDSWFKRGGLDTLYFVNPRLFALGNIPGIENLLRKVKPAASGSLESALEVARAEKHSLVGHVKFETEALAVVSPERFPEALWDFLKLREALVTANLGNRDELDARLQFDGPDSAAKAAATARALAKRPETFFEEIWAELVEAKPALDIACKTLSGLSVQSDEAVLGLSISLESDAATRLIAMASPVVEKVRVAAHKVGQLNNLRTIGLALNSYHEEHNRFPPATIGVGLSWRVALLPYLDQQSLFDQFDLNAPWDSEHNIKLLEKMPRVFSSVPGLATEKHSTFYQVFVGPGAPFQERKQLRLADFKGEKASTFLVAENSQGVPWTKPADISIENLPPLGAQFSGIFLALFADGSVRSLPRDLPAEELRDRITPSGVDTILDEPPLLKGKEKRQ